MMKPIVSLLRHKNVTGYFIQDSLTQERKLVDANSTR